MLLKAIYIYIYIHFKMNRFTSEFAFRLSIFLQHMFFFNSRICVCKWPVQINCPWQTLVSIDIVSLFLFFFFYKYVFSVFVWLPGCSCPCMCIYFSGGCFFLFITLLPLNNLWKLIYYKLKVTTNLPPWVILCVCVWLSVCLCMCIVSPV